jgi:parvulin-like peptidyl-prolyl isomerase
MRAIQTTRRRYGAIGTLLTLLAAFALQPLAHAQQPPAAPAQEAVDPVIAQVGEVTLTRSQVRQMMLGEMRKRFYHGRIPRDQLELFVVEMTQEMIDRALLVTEARRRGLAVDEAEVTDRLEQIEARYAGNPEWQVQREQVLPDIRRQIEEILLRQQLEEAVRAAPEPSPEALETFYTSNPDKFTEPERNRVSLILLGVDPAAPAEAWQKARETGRELRTRLADGADFAALAREYSTDPTAENGGDMGYLHQGMLAEEAQEALAELQPGQVTPPLQLLEGIALLRLDERIVPRHLPYDRVTDRVAALWAEAAGELAWTALLERLRSEAEIVVDDAVMADLREELIRLMN